MATIQIRRGTKAQLTTRGALAAGELGFTTDELLVYVGDGSTAANYVVGRCFSGAGEPSGNLVAGRLYTDTTSHGLWFCDGSTWVRATAAGLAINDSGTSSTDIWSAEKVQAVITAAHLGVGEFKDSVKDKSLTAPPGGEAAGDRYIIAATASGVWSGKENYIAQYPASGSTWVFTTPTEGMCTFVDDEDLLYIYSGSAWVPINNYALASGEPGAVTSSSSGAAGSASTVARSDHNHDLSIANDYVTTAMMEHGTRGDILTYNGSGGPPTRLAAGTTAYVLTASGAEGDVGWAAIPTPVVADNAITLAKVAHGASRGLPVYAGAGFDPTLLAAAANGYVLTAKGATADLEFAAPAAPAADSITLAMTAHGAQQGSLLAYQGATFIPTELVHGTAGQVLVSGGHGVDVAWGDLDGGTFV